MKDFINKMMIGYRFIDVNAGIAATDERES
jgi:hypothetical protein